MRVAFLGMGIMGSAMAANCLKAGHELTVWNRTGSKCRPLVQAGATQAETPAEAARGHDAVLMCLEDTAAVEAVLFESGGVTEGIRGQDPPALVVDHSTISAIATERLALRLSEQTGALYLDAPVSGGEKGARAATLAIMCGGPAAAFDRAQPLLSALGKTIVHVGERHGDGQRTKMINQLVVALNLIATTEGMRFGEALGMNMQNVLGVITQGAASSWSLVNMGPLWLGRHFEPGFRLRHLLKDVGYCREALEASDPHSLEMFPGMRLALELLERAVASGYGDENIHAVARIFGH